jgi:hypothetical protein
MSSLSSSKYEKALAHVRSRLPGGCPLCKGQRLTIGAVILPPYVDEDGRVVDLGGRGAAMLQVICSTCFRVELFDCAGLGI